MRPAFYPERAGQKRRDINVTGANSLYLPVPMICGLAFVCLAGLAHTAAWVAPLLGAIFLVLGAPHGGLEWREGRESVPSFAFCAIYLCAAAIIAAIWLTGPVTALLSFLALSAWHFGRADPALKTIGVAIVLGSFAVFPETTLDYFQRITGHSQVFGATNINVVRAIGVAALITPLVEALLRGHGLSRWLCVTFILIVLPPLLAVGTFFLFLHAWPDYHASLKAQGGDVSVTLRLFAPTAVPTLLGGFAMVLLFGLGYLPALWVAAAGAALAVPHILDPNARHA